MRKALFAGATLAALLLVPPADGITHGERDGMRHPSVGALIAEWRTPGVKQHLCSGTLIGPRVFLTAAHCTAALEARGIPAGQVWVSFDQDVDPVTSATTLYQGVYVTNPEYNMRQSDPADLAVVQFDEDVPLPPMALPTANLFDTMKANGTLSGQRFTAVGYGVREAEIGSGPPQFPFDGERWRSVPSFSALNDAWLRLSQTAATDDGGTCFGDSGGPNFLGEGMAETNVIASITVSGDAMCVATNTTYRLDTPGARAFLGQFVTLP